MKFKLIKIKLWWCKIFNKKTSISSEQEKAIKIVKKFLTIYDTRVECTPSQSDFDFRVLIKHKDIIIKITTTKIFVVNGVYKYEVVFMDNDPNIIDLRLYINKTINRRLDKIEHEMYSKVHDSLNTIIEQD